MAQVDLRTDPLKAFPKIAEADRAFTTQFTYTKTEGRQELDGVLDGVPVVNDPFVGDLPHVIERTRYRTTATAGTIVYQTLQTWSQDGSTPGVLPQVTVAGRLVGGGDEYAIHHTEAKLVCPKAFDRASVDAPGWCLGFAVDSAGKGQFTTAAAAQALWTEIAADGFIDYAFTARPTVDGICAP